MDALRHALLLFSKVPEPGKVKTRLTPALGGYLDAQMASDLYECMLLDVVEICCDALASLEHAGSPEAAHVADDEFALFISAPGSAQARAMRALLDAHGPWPRELQCICDVGDSFDAHYNDAFRQIWERGFDTVLSMGCDMPALRRGVIVEGFKHLRRLCADQRGGIVLSPDQEMGVSAVGWTRTTSFDHTGVFYRSDGLTVLPAYIDKARSLGLPAYYLPDVPDVDTMADLAHAATLVQALVYCARFQDDVTAPHRTAALLHDIGLEEIRVLPNELRDDRSTIDA